MRVVLLVISVVAVVGPQPLSMARKKVASTGFGFSPHGELYGGPNLGIVRNLNHVNK